MTPGDNFERLPLIPTDVVTVTVPEHGLTDARMEVERVSIEPDWSVVLNLREVLDDTYDDTLVLPELISREIYLPDETDVPAMTNLSADEIAVIDKDGKTVIHLEASWTAAPAPETEIAVREKAVAGETETSGIRERRRARTTVSVRSWSPRPTRCAPGMRTARAW